MMEQNNLFFLLIFCIGGLLIINILKNIFGKTIRQLLSLILIIVTIYYAYHNILNYDEYNSNSNDNYIKEFMTNNSENNNLNNDSDNLNNNDTRNNDDNYIIGEFMNSNNYENNNLNNDFDFDNKELFKNKNFLDCGFHLNINTLGTNVKDTNNDIRKLVPIPRTQNNPWEIFSQKSTY
jgi:hypothetical protein